MQTEKAKATSAGVSPDAPPMVRERFGRRSWRKRLATLRLRSEEEKKTDEKAQKDDVGHEPSFFERSTIGELAILLYGDNRHDVVRCALDDAASELDLLGTLVAEGNGEFDVKELGTRLWRIANRCRVALELDARGARRRKLSRGANGEASR